MDLFSVFPRIRWSICIAVLICLQFLFSSLVVDRVIAETRLDKWLKLAWDALDPTGVDDRTGRRLDRLAKFHDVDDDLGLFHKRADTEVHKSVSAVHSMGAREHGGSGMQAVGIAPAAARAVAPMSVRAMPAVPAMRTVSAMKAQIARYGNDDDYEYGEGDDGDDDDEDQAPPPPGPLPNLVGNVINNILTIIFAVVYKQQVVDKKPKLGPAPTGRVTVPDGAAPGTAFSVTMPNGKQVQLIVPQGVLPGESLEFEIPGPGFTHKVFNCMEDCDVCWTTCFCFPTRVADTYASAGVLDFWPTFLLTMCFPCCVAACLAPCKRAEIRARLGGDRTGPTIAECCLVYWCWGCTAVQEARAVDEALGVRTKCCCNLESITESRVPLVTVGVGDSVLVTPSAPSLSAEIPYAQPAPASSPSQEHVVEGRPVATAAPLQVAGRDVMLQDLPYQSPAVPAS